VAGCRNGIDDKAGGFDRATVWVGGERRGDDYRDHDEGRE
jgi:hypothetical protein